MKGIKRRIAIAIAVSMVIMNMLPAYAEEITASEQAAAYEECVEQVTAYEECVEQVTEVTEEVLPAANDVEEAQEISEENTAEESISEDEVSEVAEVEDISLLGADDTPIYSAKFSYGGKDFYNEVLNSFKLSELQKMLEITGTVSEASSSNTELFTVDQDIEKTDWIVTILQPFNTDEEKLNIKIKDGPVYEIVVTGLGESMIVTIDAGYGEITTFRRPHTMDIIVDIGQKYPDVIFKKEAAFHRKYHKANGLYYFNDEHKKVTIDENSTVSKDIKRIYVEWEPESSATVSNILVNGSTYGINYFDAYEIIGGEEFKIGQDDYLCFYYEREQGADEVKVRQTQHGTIKALQIDINKRDGSLMTIQLQCKRNTGSVLSPFDYWMVNNTRIEPNQDYPFSLFDPNVNLEVYAVCEYDEVDSSVTGGTGHSNYQISYEDGLGSYTITQNKLDLDLFAGREFYYQHNSDHSMEIWFGDDDEICQQHYTIRPVSRNNYEFSSWTINGKTLAVGDRTYIELDDIVASGDKTLNFNTTYSYNGSPSPSHGSGNTTPQFTTGTWNNPVSNGTWSFNPVTGTWSYATSQIFRSTWGYIVNPFTTLPNHKADWYYFDQFGNMLTGWQWITDSDGVTRRYYLYPANTEYGLAGACQIGGITPDGCALDFATGAWAVNGIIQTR